MITRQSCERLSQETLKLKTVFDDGVTKADWLWPPMSGKSIRCPDNLTVHGNLVAFGRRHRLVHL